MTFCFLGLINQWNYKQSQCTESSSWLLSSLSTPWTLWIRVACWEIYKSSPSSAGVTTVPSLRDLHGFKSEPGCCASNCSQAWKPTCWPLSLQTGLICLGAIRTCFVGSSGRSEAVHPSLSSPPLCLCSFPKCRAVWAQAMHPWVTYPRVGPNKKEQSQSVLI